jgi:hypothetical protein
VLTIKYFILKYWKESVYVDKDLSEVSALENFDEIHAEVPAYNIVLLFYFHYCSI